MKNIKLTYFTSLTSLNKYGVVPIGEGFEEYL